MEHTTTKPAIRQRLEGRVRRNLELLFLGVTLFIGTVVVGGCAVISFEDGSALTLLAVIAGGLFIVGIVYLATSMSRDVRLLRAKLLEQEERDQQHVIHR